MLKGLNSSEHLVYEVINGYVSITVEGVINIFERWSEPAIDAFEARKAIEYLINSGHVNVVFNPYGKLELTTREVNSR